MNFLHHLFELFFPQPISSVELIRLPRAPRIDAPYLFSLFNYQNKKVQVLIKYLKNHRDAQLSQCIGLLMYDCLFEYISEQQEYHYPLNICIVPVPISKSTQKSRGFNQTLHYSKTLAKKLSAKIVKEKELTKKDTKKQSLLSKSERLSNIRRAFVLKNKKIVAGKDCIIVDDLITTGASMNELRNLLLASGAQSVIGISVAH